MILDDRISTLGSRVLKFEKIYMAELNDRQKLILALIIHDYVDTNQPVASSHLLEQYDLDVSSATVRNTMMDLTRSGHLRQPHTSAGRVPTEEGYRYFVRQLMGHTDLPINTKRTITRSSQRAY